MSPADDNDNADALRQRLEELESLLHQKETVSTPAKIKVPVLDEQVTEADLVNEEDEDELAQLEEQINILAEKLAEKFSGELDRLVSLLKHTLKSSIIQELRKQANLTGDQAAVNHSHSRATDTDPEDRNEQAPR